MTGRPLRTVPVDGSPGAVRELAAALRRALDGSGPAVLPVAAGAPVPDTDGRDVPADVAVVVATSGSTGAAKHVLLTAEALRASASATERRLGGPGRWLLALPAEHVAGVQVVLRALLAGAEPAVQDLRDGFRARGFARATATLPTGAPRYTSLVPTQLARILDDDGPYGEAARGALAGYSAVLIGGAALDPGLRERARRAGIAVVTTYGMSETCGGCVYDGVPLDGVTVDVEGGDGGRVLLGGPVLAAGYLDPADDGAFAGGRFRTGDTGRVDDGVLTVLGRADDMINSGGEKVAPAAVERALLRVPGVRAVCVAGLPDERWGQVVAALVVAGDGTDDDLLRSAVRDSEGRAAVPRLLRRVDRIPERGIGKPDRAAAARILAGDTTDG